MKIPIEWMIPIMASVIGAAAASMFNRLLNRQANYRKIILPPEDTRDVQKAFHELHEWGESVDNAIESQQRQIERLRREVRLTRYLLDAFLILLLAACLCYYWLS